MKISKSQFLEYIRCPRYSALDDVYYNHKESYVEFSDIQYDSTKYLEMINELLNDYNGEVEQEQLKVMLPYFNEVELLAGTLLEKKFGHPVVMSLKTSEQKYFACDYDDFKFTCYVDAFQAHEKGFNLCEVKAKSSTKLWKYGVSKKDYQASSVDELSIFMKCDDGIVRLKEETNYQFNDVLTKEKYAKIKSKLFDYRDDFGRVMYDIAFQRFVIEKNMALSSDDKFYLAIINRDYVFDGTYENQKPVYNENGEEIILLIDVTQITADLQGKILMEVNKVIKYVEAGNANPYPLGDYCLRKKIRQCKFYDICFKHVPDKNSIFTYINNHFGFKSVRSSIKYLPYELINDGLVEMTALDDEYLSRANNLIQKQCVIENKIHFDKKKIKKALKCLEYPIYHLDFESLPLPLPRYRGERSYDQSVFQFSVHVEKAPNVCDFNNDHFEYLAKDHGDCRESLIQKMLEVIDLSEGGTVLVYNQGFEKARLRELANLFPKYASQLQKINDAVFDLMYLLKGNKKLFESFGYDSETAKIVPYYHPDLNGSYSIKAVLPLFTNLTYKDLEVQNGAQAMVTYANYNKYSREEFEFYYKALINYCKQDTWAMVEILRGLRSDLDEPSS